MAIDTHEQYQQIIEQIHQLTPEQLLELMSELASIIHQRMQEPTKPKRSIMELEGLGKEIWEGIDVEQYIRESRGSYPSEE